MLRPDSLLLGRYRILRELGQGGMGAVYEATDERFGTPIALKEIIFETSDEKQQASLAAAFEREAKSLAKIQHECIPFVRDYFSEENREYLVMELVEGDDLWRLLEKQKRPFALPEVIDWMRQLLDALDYLHNLKPQIVHRDIKPQNLKVTSRRRLKLLDFGIAKSGDRSAGTTRNHTFVGATLDYSPIEQILRVIDATFREYILLKHEDRAKAVLDQQTDERADIFAAGGTFYHLLTNTPPKDATKRALTVWEGGEDPLPHPSDLKSHIPRAIGDVLIKAMAIERKNRYGSADEMLTALNSISVAKIMSTPNTGEITEIFTGLPMTGLIPSELAPTDAFRTGQPLGITGQPAAGMEPLPINTKPPVRVESDPAPSPIVDNAAPLDSSNSVPLPARGKARVLKFAGASAAFVVLAFIVFGVAWFGGLIGGNGTTRGATANAANKLSVTNAAEISSTPYIKTDLTPNAVSAAEPRAEPNSSISRNTEIANTKTYPKPGTRRPREPVSSNPTAEKPPKKKNSSQDLNCVYTNSCKN